MENYVFQTPAVAEELKDNFIEARLHTDRGHYAEFAQGLRAELVGSLALPIFVVMDPETKEVGGILEGARSPADFNEFLQSSRSKLGI